MNCPKCKALMELMTVTERVKHALGLFGEKQDGKSSDLLMDKPFDFSS